MKTVLFLLALAAGAPLVNAQESSPKALLEDPQLLVFGTFHFKDAGLDIVKVDDLDVLAPEVQVYLQKLAQRLADFEPTHVLLEYTPGNVDTINERFQAYRAGDFELPANEIYQLGFRIAKLAELESVQGFDEREVQWNAEPLFEYAEAHQSPEMQQVRQFLDEVAAQTARDRASMSMRELLQQSNDPERDRLNMDLYLMTNGVGAGDGWAGADAAASWWHRNFRMYANIQKVAKPGARIIAIGGSGHTAILKQLADIDRRIQRVPVGPFL